MCIRDRLNAVLLQDRVEEVIENFEPRANVQQVIVQDEIDQNRYRVTISFYVNNMPEPVTITEFLQRLR